MKFLAVLQIACVIFLSSFSGMKNTAEPVTKTNCCKHLAKNSLCNKQPVHQKDNCDQKNKKNNCNKSGCTMMLSCSICGFLATEPLTLNPVLFAAVEKPVPVYKIGNLSAYFASDWKPPEV